MGTAAEEASQSLCPKGQWCQHGYQSAGHMKGSQEKGRRQSERMMDGKH